MKNMKKGLSFLLGLMFMLSLIGCSSTSENTTPTVSTQQVGTNKTLTKEVSKEKKNTISISNDNKVVNGTLKVHYINVGQGDSILVQQGSKNMLIDTGTNASTSSLMAYLKSLNLKKIDVLVLTHPHEDHIGGADAVIKAFNIGTLYMNKVTTTTKTYKDVINAMISSPINTNSKDLNTYSIVIKLVYGHNKFLFTGDAQASNEEDMINKGFDLSADVLKVGHHGSDTSTSDAFLSKVNPKYTVISCGKNNDYGHPHKSTMDKLQAKGIAVYRTDESGTIVCTLDGKNISFNVKAGDYKYGSVGGSSSSSKSTPKVVLIPESGKVTQSTQSQNVTVYVTKTGKKYHVDGCSSLSKSKIPMSLKEAKKEGYTPCEKCNPPQ